MRRMLMALALMAMTASMVGAGSRDTGPTPMIKGVQPDSVKAGDEVTLSGTNLDKNSLAALNLTQGDKTIKVKITSQSGTDVKFTVPTDLPAGRYGVMVLTTGGDDARELDEPVALTIE